MTRKEYLRCRKNHTTCLRMWLSLDTRSEKEALNKQERALMMLLDGLTQYYGLKTTAIECGNMTPDKNPFIKDAKQRVNHLREEYHKEGGDDEGLLSLLESN